MNSTSPTDTTGTVRPDHLYVCADTTPGVHRTDSDDAAWWLPVLGPTATVLAATLARSTPPGGVRWDTTELAQRIGLAGNRSKLWASLNRLDQFHVAQFHATDVLTVRLWLPALSERQLARLPLVMADQYRATTSFPQSLRRWPDGTGGVSSPGSSHCLGPRAM
jgi:hypothetical protein